jgi:hypothetical protein
MACSFSANMESLRLTGRLSSQRRYSSWRSTNAATAAAQRCGRRGLRRGVGTGGGDRSWRIVAEPGPMSRLALGWCHWRGAEARSGHVLSPWKPIVTVTFANWLGHSWPSRLCLAVFTFFVRSGNGRSSSRRLRSAARSARKASRDQNASGAGRRAALAQLVFCSALTPENGQGQSTGRRAGGGRTG